MTIAEETIEELRAALADAKLEARHWKVDHDNLALRCQLLLQRRDLPVDRTLAYAKLVKLQEELQRFKEAEREAV
ncbi:MAG: hypothetical protein ABI612_20270 [Betaproteobacteria bacterium]